MTARVIPLRAVVPPRPARREGLASGAASAIPYSAWGPSNRFDKLFDPIAFNDALYEREIEAVREALA